MRAIAPALILSLTLAACAAPSAAPPANPPAPEGFPTAPPATEEHRWLRQMVGTWDVVAETMGAAEAGAPEEMRARFRETVEPLGEYWIHSRLEASFGDTAFRSNMIVGWDPAKSTFVGSWVDSLSTNQWVYSGSLDAAKQALTLEADGPSFGDPTAITRFRDVTEFDGPDVRRNSSWMKGPDGEWMLLARSTATRRK